MEPICVGDVLVSHKGDYHYIVESISGNVARILWLERVSGERQEFSPYHRFVDINVAPSFYKIIPADQVDRAHYKTFRDGWPKG